MQSMQSEWCLCSVFETLKQGKRVMKFRKKIELILKFKIILHINKNKIYLNIKAI